MGRLSKYDINNADLVTSNNSLTGLTNNNIIYIDENGNTVFVKNRIKSYKEEEKKGYSYEPCVIGVSDPIMGNCSEGIAMGTGDIGSDSEMAYAVYD